MQQYVGEIDIFLIVCLEITVNLHISQALSKPPRREKDLLGAPKSLFEIQGIFDKAKKVS